MTECKLCCVPVDMTEAIACHHCAEVYCDSCSTAIHAADHPESHELINDPIWVEDDALWEQDHRDYSNTSEG